MLLRRKEPAELTFDACKTWLKYRPVQWRGVTEVAVPAQRIGSGFKGGPNERVGGYRGALREAQFFWAVQSFGDPFLQSAAVAMRSYPRPGQVLYWLAQNYALTWEGWKAEHPGSEAVFFELLRDHIAELMTEILGEDLY